MLHGKVISYLITCNPQIYSYNRYCCVCFSFVIKIEWEGYQVQWCYTELSVYQHGPVTNMEGKEATHATCSSINFYQDGHPCPVTWKEVNFANEAFSHPSAIKLYF